jgi:hypothetical protein
MKEEGRYGDQEDDRNGEYDLLPGKKDPLSGGTLYGGGQLHGGIREWMRCMVCESGSGRIGGLYC